MSIITVFGSGAVRPDTDEYKDAEKIGSMLASAGFDIATGAYYGIMEAVFKGASDFSIEKIGVTCIELKEKKVNEFVTKEIETHTYLHRLEKLIDLGDAYIILPGGTGTLLEMSAIWALKERNILKNKPAVILGELWNEIIQLSGFYSETALESAELIKKAESAENAVEIIKFTLNNNGTNFK